MSTVEVIVVDNGSVHPPVDVVRAAPGARLLLEPSAGSYAARNAGLAASQGEIIAFTDADCIPSRSWLTAGVRVLDDDPQVGLVAGLIQTVASDRGGTRSLELFEMVHAFPQQRYVEQLDFGATANVLTRRRVVDAVGPFDEQLLSGGDKKWGRQVAAAGFRLVYAPDAVVQHPARSSWAQYRAKLDRVYDGEIAARRRRGEGVGTVGRLRWLSLAPPVRSIVRHWPDPRLQTLSDKARYAVGASVARWLGVTAGLRARRRARGHEA